MNNKTLLAATLVAMGSVGVGASTPVLPDFGAATFTPNAPIDHAYFPLTPGTVFTYAADLFDPDSGETESILIEEFVTFDTRVVAGVVARTVRVREWKDGLLVEDTDDWYAQDTDGNVWYMGESSTAFLYDDDNPIGTDTAGSWEAGVNGALPGYLMPAAPAVGFAYFQESAAADGALDEAEVLSTTTDLTTALGDFMNVLVVLESTRLEPGAYGNKLYAPGVGLVLIEEGVDASGMNPGGRVPLVSVTTIPEPGLLALPVLLVPLGRRPRWG